MKKRLFTHKVILAGLLLASFGCQRPTESSYGKVTKTDMEISDPHSFAKPEEAVMTHLDWDAYIDFEDKVIEGEAAITFSATPNATHLILDTKNLNIISVRWPEKGAATFELGEKDEILGQPLKIDLVKGEDRVIIDYVTDPSAEALQWLAPQQTAGKKQPFLFTQSQAILARSWIPLQDSPGIRFSYDAYVTVPKEASSSYECSKPSKENLKR